MRFSTKWRPNPRQELAIVLTALLVLGFVTHYLWMGALHGVLYSYEPLASERSMDGPDGSVATLVARRSAAGPVDLDMRLFRFSPPLYGKSDWRVSLEIENNGSQLFLDPAQLRLRKVLAIPAHTRTTLVFIGNWKDLDRQLRQWRFTARPGSKEAIQVDLPRARADPNASPPPKASLQWF